MAFKKTFFGSQKIETNVIRKPKQKYLNDISEKNPTANKEFWHAVRRFITKNFN